MEELQARVVYEKANIGLAFDGDADRLLAVDELGNVVDGDQIMAIVGAHMRNMGKLKQNTIVATVMSNLGLFLFGEKKRSISKKPRSVTVMCWSVCGKSARALAVSSPVILFSWMKIRLVMVCCLRCIC